MMLPQWVIGYEHLKTKKTLDISTPVDDTTILFVLGTTYSVTWCQHPRRTDISATLLQKPKNLQGCSLSVTGSLQFWLHEISIC